MLNTVEKGQALTLKGDYWDPNSWSFFSYNFDINALGNFNLAVIDFYHLNENRDFELCKQEIFQLMIEGLQYLREELKAVMNVDNICFFITLSDGDIEIIENDSAKQINSGYILEDFLARFN